MFIFNLNPRKNISSSRKPEFLCWRFGKMYLRFQNSNASDNKKSLLFYISNISCWFYLFSNLNFSTFFDIYFFQRFEISFSVSLIPLSSFQIRLLCLITFLCYSKFIFCSCPPKVCADNNNSHTEIPWKWIVLHTT